MGQERPRLDITRTYPVSKGAWTRQEGPLPETLGSFRIVRKLGEGGMGVVYEAEQPTPRRRVALKVIRGGPHISEGQIRLFQHEAETLARLRHRSIAQIYEAGLTPEGQHFFAMELVQGEPLLDYIKNRADERVAARSREGIRWRLGLFLEVCAAISYAHQRGVIHRDIKPSNILVAEQPGGDRRSGSQPTMRVGIKVLDFGLARITDAEASIAADLTEFGQIKGTLAYMSPEQARGSSKDLDIRADIYSLGVLLYEMLTGDLPYDVNKTLISEAVRVICDEQPRRLSATHRLLRGDLETIVLKALEKQPERRYQSADALADDIERFLSNQPIQARPPSAVYQLRKLIERYKVPFAFGVALAMLVVASTIAMYFMAERQRQLRHQADRERAEVQRLNDSLQATVQSLTAIPTVSPTPVATPVISPVGSAQPVPPAPPVPRAEPPVRTPQAINKDAPAPRALDREQQQEPDLSEAIPLPWLRANVAEEPRPSSDPVSPQALLDAVSNVTAAEIQIVMGQYAEAEALLLASYPVIMGADVEVRSKRDCVERLIRLYRAWGRPDMVLHYERVLTDLASS